MADAETSQQRQERIRKEKREAREAKITSNATGRLDKITALSGRLPDSSKRKESPTPIPPSTTNPPRSPTSPAQPQVPRNAAVPEPSQIQAQEEFLRAMLRAQNPQQQGAPGSLPEGGPDQEDPMMKMLSSMLGGLNDDPNAPPGNMPSPNDLAKAAGLPPFLTNILMGGQQKAPPTPAQAATTRMWKMIHILFAIIAGIYTVFTIGRSISTFGSDPPAPATFQNPVVAFLTGELLIQGSKTVSSNQVNAMGLGYWMSILKDLSRDAAIVVFLLGIFSWWNGAV